MKFCVLLLTAQAIAGLTFNVYIIGGRKEMHWGLAEYLSIPFFILFLMAATAKRKNTTPYLYAFLIVCILYAVGHRIISLDPTSMGNLFVIIGIPIVSLSAPIIAFTHRSKSGPDA